jgi:hypothetical protein
MAFFLRPDSSPSRPVEYQKLSSPPSDSDRADIRNILRHMSDIVPLDHSLPQLPKIESLLAADFNPFTRIFRDSRGHITGFIACHVLPIGFPTLYIDCLAASAETGLQFTDISRLLQTCRECGLTRVSFHGYNTRLNQIMVKRYGFQPQPELDNIDPRTGQHTPYYVLELQPDNLPGKK